MSESSSVAEAAGSTASNAGGAAGSVVDGSSLYVNGIGQTAGGGEFTLGAAEGANVGVGPTVANAADPSAYNAASAQVTADQAKYGTADPSWWDKTMAFLSDYQKGTDANLAQAWKNKGFNGQTAGYIGNKMSGMMKGGGATGQAAPVTINNSYQQPENEYLKRYMLLTRRG